MQRIEKALMPDSFVSAGSACRSWLTWRRSRRRWLGLSMARRSEPWTCARRSWPGAARKSEEIDDSSGSFGTFVVSLVVGWVRRVRLRAATLARPPRACSRGWTRTSTATCTGSIQMWLPYWTRLAVPRSSSRSATVRCGAEHRLREAAVGRNGADPVRGEQGRHGVRRPDGADRAHRSHCLAVAKMLRVKRTQEQALSWVERGLHIDAATPAEVVRRVRATANPHPSCGCGTRDQSTAGASGSTSPAASATPSPSSPCPFGPKTGTPEQGVDHTFILYAGPSTQH